MTTHEPKEKPILFSGPMVRAIMAGNKTVTRRIVKPQLDKFEIKDNGIMYYDFEDCKCHKGICASSSGVYPTREHAVRRFCETHAPYAPGDLLWVRETFKYDDQFKGGGVPRLGIKFGDSVIWKEGCPIQKRYGPWKPSIFMPKWACRIWLRVKDVRPERLQEITGQDAIAEGWPKDQVLFPAVNTEGKAIGWFRDLWSSLNGAPKPKYAKGIITHYEAYPWDESDFDYGVTWRGKPLKVYANPWVWRIEFELVSTTGKAGIE